MNIVSLGKWVLGLLDALALASIYATTEIRVEAGMVLLAVFLVRTLGVRLRSLGLLVGLVFSIVCLGLFVAFKFHVHPVLIAAHVGVVVHAILWLGKDEVRDRVLRLSMGFVNLTLASALTADFYLFGSIFAFAILGSVYVSLGFLESTFRARVPEQLTKPLPQGYLKNMLYVSFAVFLISILLFPMIPRASWKREESSNYYQIGYNDSVDLSSSGQAAMKRSGRVALRIVSQSPEILEDPLGAIPLGMLKGQTLDLFDGKRWFHRRIPSSNRASVTPDSQGFPKAQFEVIREPHVNGMIFRPYGSQIIEVGSEAGRSHYLFRVREARGELEQQEAPDNLDLEVPEEARSPRIEKLAREIMGKAGTSSDKAHLLGGFFKKGFSGTLEATQTSIKTQEIIENFLFVGKSGTCQLFAASTAILLRLADVPARVIAGYRVLRPSSGGLLTVLDDDAHAWVEYWNETRGWVPLDNTPLQYIASSWMDPFQQLYWRGEGLWFHWLINFRKDNGTPSEAEPVLAEAASPVRSDWSSALTQWSSKVIQGGGTWFSAIGLLLVLLLMAKLALGLISFEELKQLFRLRLSQGRRRLHFEYLRFQRFARKADQVPDSARAISDEWQGLYARLRFGRPEPETFDESIRGLSRLRKKFIRSVSD